MRRSVWIVVAALAVVCAAILLLPVVLVEPDDFDWYQGMISFSRGHFISSEEMVREIHHEIAERFGRTERYLTVPIIRNERGFVHERSPGYYGLLALFYLVGLNRFTNLFLFLACVLFFFHFVKKYADEKIALYGSLLMIFNPTFLTGLYRVYMSDFSYFVVGLFGMGVYWIARKRGKPWLYALAGFLLSVSVIFRITNVIFFVAIALYELCLLIFPKVFAGAEGDPRKPSVLAPRCLVPLAAGVIVGIIPLLLYNRHTMGKIFAAGYSYRFSQEGTKYFSLFGRNAIFSLRNLSYTFPVGLPRLLLGYPIVLLAPAGFFLLGRQRRRLALFAGLWFATYWALYLCYSTIREDSFQFMCRKFLPSLPALSIGGAAVFHAVKGKWKTIALATIAIFGIAVASEFVVRFVVPQPLGRRRFPGRRPPMEAFRGIAERLGKVEELLGRDVPGAILPLRECVMMLKDVGKGTPGPEGRELDAASRKLHDYEEQLARSVKNERPITRERIEEIRRLLRETRSKLERLVPPSPGPPRFGPGRPPEIPSEVLRRVELLNRLIEEAETDAIDTTVAAFLDEVARTEIERRNFGEAVELLDEAIVSLGGTPPSGVGEGQSFPRPRRGKRPVPPRGRPVGGMLRDGFDAGDTASGVADGNPADIDSSSAIPIYSRYRVQSVRGRPAAGLNLVWQACQAVCDSKGELPCYLERTCP